MRLLVRSCREKDFGLAAVCAASSGTAALHFDDFVCDEPRAELLLLHSVSDKIFDVSRTTFVRICYILGNSK